MRKNTHCWLEMPGKNGLKKFAPLMLKAHSHVGPSDGFANCQHISGIIFTGFICQPVWRNEFRGHQFNVVPILLEKPCPVMSA
ncbi:hypothetical protein SEEM1594_02779 [Salmonella enterica subsp. enterica serovar Muenchen str. baa1594]|nr:hypothetical protein SEEM1594_02779 [Salmonella enterica subsp. enterica serovar Muenchen str. baa1594]